MANTSSAAPSAVTEHPAPADTGVAPAPTTTEGLLRPSSPRKRRRSLEGAEPSPASLEGQVRDKLTVSPTPNIALTGASQMAELKRRKLEHQAERISQGTGTEQSVNPQQQALGALRGAPFQNMSRVAEGPPSVTTSSAASSAPALKLATSAQTSPTSQSSFNTSPGATAGGPQVASPTEIDGPDGADDELHSVSNGNNQQPGSPKAFTYPDPRLSAAPVNINSNRNNSVAGTADAARSPAGSNKKHKCQYCDTEFTRHHNLKSHLLTHSQEKPYLCQQCDMRFRRLHDLKRHTKLHTGERPHVCNRCNRKFARGDALARHTKGAGGCAGHRASVGSFTNEAGDQGEMVMDGLMYSGHESQEPGEMDENDGPGRQLRQAQYSSSLQPPRGSGLPQTYPPVNPRTGAYLHAPPPTHSGNASPAAQQGSYGHAGPQGSYPPPFHGNMTESPGPISPSGLPDHKRSSISSQLHQYARQGTTHAHGSPTAPTATMGLPPSTAAVPSNAPANPHYSHLPPPLPSITTSNPRSNAAHGHTHNASGSYASAPGSASTFNSLSSHGQGSGDRGGLGIDERERLYALINAHEKKIADLEKKLDKSNALEKKIADQDSKLESLVSLVEVLQREKASANINNAVP